MSEPRVAFIDPETGDAIEVEREAMARRLLKELTLEERMESCLEDLLAITGSQVKDGRINADMMLAESKQRAALTHVKIYVAGIAT